MKPFESFHWNWAKVFGKRVPTAHERAHIGQLILKHCPGQSTEGFGKTWDTDARRVYVIGDLWIFDYGDTPVQTFTPEHYSPELHSGKDWAKDNAELLAWNKREYVRMT